MTLSSFSSFDSSDQRLTKDDEPVAERRAKFFSQDFLIRADSGSVISGEVRTIEQRRRLKRDPITGEPIVPEQVNLTALPDLPGWASYFGETVATPAGQWQQLGDLEHGGGIVGRRDPRAPGSLLERLLRYNRPMFEDGTIEYEFYYDPNRSQVHPALDRLVFLLEPKGVQLHWATHGADDPNGLDPTNSFEDPKSRRGPDRLPLVASDWNKVRLALTADTVAISLNGQLVFQRELPGR